MSPVHILVGMLAQKQLYFETLLRSCTMFTCMVWLEAYVLLIRMISTIGLHGRISVVDESHSSTFNFPSRSKNGLIFQKYLSSDRPWPTAVPFVNFVGAPNAPTNKSVFRNTPINETSFGSPASDMKCEGSKYGYGLSIESCQEVWDYLPKSEMQRKIGQRQHGTFDIPLPFRILSCKCWHILC